MSTHHHLLQTRLETPLGPISATRSARGLSGLWFDGQKHHPGPLELPLAAAGDAVFARLALWLAAYFRGQVLPTPAELTLDPLGTPFQLAVWQALRAIPAGSSRSYGQLAGALGRPKAVRAVGAAIGRNPLSILIPCHRALGADGRLTGYAGGLSRKSALLRLEGATFVL